MSRQQNPFTKYADEAAARGEMALATRLQLEGKVVRFLVQHALKAGYTVSVNDGEDWCLRHSMALNDIIAACFSTDSDTLRFRDPKDRSTNNVGARVGDVLLVYGNSGYDVISDYSAADQAKLDAFTAWMAPVEAYAESLENKLFDAADAAADAGAEDDEEN